MNNFLYKLDLNGKWDLSKAGDSEKCKVDIPGSVISGLLSNALIKDPYKGLNEYETLEILKNDFTFERSFDFEKQSGLDYELVFEGLDTLAKVYLNEKEILTADNMHITYTCNVTKLLKNGSNTLRVSFSSAVKYIESVTPGKDKEIHYTPTGAMTGNQYIRKAHSMFGWDWGIKLPDMGIFRDVYIRGFKEVLLEEIKVAQTHNADRSVTLDITGIIHSKAGHELKVGAHEKENYSIIEKGYYALFEKGNYKLSVDVINPDGSVFIQGFDANGPINILNPLLWWPNGLGNQFLYTVKVRLTKNGECLNEITKRIGLRTFTISTEPDEYGSEFAYTVNGQRFFAMGADYIPEDAIYSRITKERIKYLIDASVAANFNTLRIWGGGYYPSDYFYDYCDEKGLVIWQDFMFACNVYELTKDFEKSIETEAVQNVRRLRDHASLGLWCGNNECESAWDHWPGFMDHSKALKKDYLKMFEEILPNVVKKEDGEHFYHPSSPSSGGAFTEPDAEGKGDCHYWAVWHGMKPFSDYEKHYFRFCSEFGFESFPELSTIKTFASPGDFNIFSRVMESHQKNGSANAKILHYTSENFLYPNSFESLVYVSQVLQGIAMKFGVEHFRRNRGRCMGAVYWQLNDNWPVASWSSIDYFGRYKALHYMAKKFFAPVLGSLRREGNLFTPYVSNESLRDTSCTMDFYVKNMDNEPLMHMTQTIMAGRMSVAAGTTIDIKSALNYSKDTLYTEAVFTFDDGSVSRQVEPLSLYKYMQLKNPEITANFNLADSQTIEATLSSKVFAAFVALNCEEMNIIWDDNFFFLTGDEVKVRGKLAAPVTEIPDIKVMSLFDSYDC